MPLKKNSLSTAKNFAGFEQLGQQSIKTVLGSFKKKKKRLSFFPKQNQRKYLSLTTKNKQTNREVLSQGAFQCSYFWGVQWITFYCQITGKDSGIMDGY